MADRLPQNSSQFLAAIELQKRLPFWKIADTGADAEDDTCPRTVMFMPTLSISRLGPIHNSGTVISGYVALEYGQMLVSLNQGFVSDARNWYWFELDRIHRDPWLRSHVQQKTWFDALHHAFFDELFCVLPSARVDHVGSKGKRAQP